MKRRTFIKLSSFSLMAVALDSCFSSDKNREFKISIHSDSKIGHKVFQNLESVEIGETISHKVLIVGGGVAGLAAAYKVREIDFMLCELSDRFGGSSGAISIQDVLYSQGAHYDFAYPDYYGKEVINVLEELKIVRYEPHGKIWNFVDKEHLVSSSYESRTYDHGDFREDLFEDEEMTKAFYKLIVPFTHKMKMPTTRIDADLSYLNEMTFAEFLKDKIELDKDFLRALDYQLVDDYGAASEEVSALAGIHYFTCRPYKSQRVQLFSPREGNYYFVNKLVQKLPKDRIKINQAVLKIVEKGEGFEVDIYNGETNKIDKVICEKIVYAGQKHALKHIYNKDYSLFQHEYAPWLVVNVHVTEPLKKEVPYWQNEIINDNVRLLGFVNSRSQEKDANNQVFTFYFCFSKEDRKMLLNLEEHKQRITNECVNLLESIFDTDLTSLVDTVYFKPMGHAMPIPRTGFLLNDVNKQTKNKNITYAGVDTGRLPLFFEAMDSGIQAVNELDL